MPHAAADRNLQPSTAGRPSERFFRSNIIAISILIALGVVLPAIVSALTGAFGLPWNDDWTYRNTALQFLSTGHFSYGGWSSMTLVGQVLWSWPFLQLFGTHGWVFSLSTMVLASAGLAAGYYLARKLLTPKRAFGAVAFLLLVPGEAMSASTFMTDIPSLSAILICLALGVAALESNGRRHWALLTLSVLVGVFAFAIREFALPAPVAVLAIAVLRARRRPLYLILSAIALGLCFGLYEWSEHLPGLQNIPLGAPSVGSLTRLIQAYFTVSLMVSPAIGLVAVRRRRLPRAAWALGALVLLLAAACSSFRGGLLVGDYFDPHGMNRQVLNGPQATLMSATAWNMVSLAAAVSGSFLAVVMCTRLMERQSIPPRRSSPVGAQVVGMFLALLAAGTAVYAVTTPVFFDRYLWPLALPLSIVLLRSKPAERGSRIRAIRLWACATCALLLSLLTVVLTVNADTFLAARWHAGEVTVEHGVPTNVIDAGIEWVGAHNVTRVDQNIDTATPMYEPSYAHIHPGFRDCAVVSASPLNMPNLVLLEQLPWKRYGLFGQGVLYLYRTPMPGCPG